MQYDHEISLKITTIETLNQSFVICEFQSLFTFLIYFTGHKGQSIFFLIEETIQSDTIVGEKHR